MCVAEFAYAATGDIDKARDSMSRVGGDYVRRIVLSVDVGVVAYDDRR